MRCRPSCRFAVEIRSHESSILRQSARLTYFSGLRQSADFWGRRVPVRTRGFAIAFAPVALSIGYLISGVISQKPTSPTAWAVLGLTSAVGLLVLLMRLVTEALQRRSPFLLLAAWLSPLIPVLFCELVPVLIWLNSPSSEKNYERPGCLAGAALCLAGFVCGLIGLFGSRTNGRSALIAGFLGLLLSGCLGFLLFALGTYRD